MSISLLSHRLVFRKVNTLPPDIESRMNSAYALGYLHGDWLRKLAFRAIEAHSRRLPDELSVKAENYACNRAITAAYYHGVSVRLLSGTTRGLAREEAKKLAARAQRLMVQLILSVKEFELERLQRPILPSWVVAFTGAASVARVAYACHKLGYEVRYPRPLVDVLHDVDLFCGVNMQVYLAIQVKTYSYSGAFAVNTGAPGFWQDVSRRFGTRHSFGYKIHHFLRGLRPLSQKAKQRSIKLVPVWALCSKQQSGLDCAELRADFADIASTWNHVG